MRNAVIGLLTIGFITLSSNSAFAQFYADPDDTPSNFVSVTTTSTSLVVGAVVLTVSLATNRKKAVQTYLMENPASVQTAIHLGAGDALEDLAEIFSTDIKTLAAIVRKRRRELSELAQVKRLSEARASAFVSIIEHAILELDS